MVRFLLPLLLALTSLVWAQRPPQLGDLEPQPQAEAISRVACTASRERAPRSEEAWTAEYAQRQAYRALFPKFLAAVPLERDLEVLMPGAGVSLSQISDTRGAARREGRTHEGTDIFAPTGTPVYSATPGYVYWIGTNPYGGKVGTVVGGAGVRYYDAHLSAFAEGLKEGQVVTPETLLGYVGNTGNARTTPPHLHLGGYSGAYEMCGWKAENPYGLLVDREW
jgi:peptidoglycan LD-endopeptidase LytH